MTRTVLTTTQKTGVTLAPGGTTEVRLGVHVAPGYHVQANPASDPFFIPLTLEIEAGRHVRAGNPIYPPGQPLRLAGAESELWIYDGTFEVRVPLMADPTADPGPRVLAGSLRFQACDDRSCLAPSSIPVEITARVDARAA